MAEPVDWTGPAPRSARFDDIYFSPEDGPSETAAVFLEGCGLPQAWRGKGRFVVGELGFGSGLNVLCLIALWAQTRPDPSAMLHIFSVEAFPMGAADAARIHAAWPDLAAFAAPLIQGWPRGRQGFHRIEWPAYGVVLDLAVLEAEAALAAWSGAADAWFLDGFAPSKNPDMWRPAVLDWVARRSAPGARAASFSVAGAVRRGLAAAGFSVSRAKGFGRKKERLTAILAEDRLAESRPAESRPAESRLVEDHRAEDHRVEATPARRPKTERRAMSLAVIGAGIAGAALVRAFNRLGVTARLFETAEPGCGASGNASALVAPRLDAALGAAAALHAQAFARAVAVYQGETPEAVLCRGVAIGAVQDKDPLRFARIAGWDGFDPGDLELLAADAAAAALLEERAPQTLLIRSALVIEPLTVLRRWAGSWDRRAVAGLQRTGDAWRLLDAAGAALFEADGVCVAAGPAGAGLLPGLPLRPVRGQVTLSPHRPAGSASVQGGYVLPAPGGALFGATHSRDDWDLTPRLQDQARNLDQLLDARPRLGRILAEGPLGDRVGLRAMTPDHMPLAGPVPGAPGAFVLSGFGGRGFTLAPLLAELVAAQALGAPWPLPHVAACLVDPRRFEDRRASKGRASKEGQGHA